MLLKWIVCRVTPNRRGDFDTAQRAWSALRDADGFLAQVGGWCETGEHLEACVLAAWRDRPAYDLFMTALHDTITDRNAQDRCYDRIDVTRAQQLIVMRGSATSFAAAGAGAGLLRVADCRVAPERRPHFVETQRTLWEPAMAAAPGLRGGAFSVADDDDNRFLVTTFWDAGSDHARYVEHDLPALRERAEATTDLRAIHGHRVMLEPAWTVRP